MELLYSVLLLIEFCLAIPIFILLFFMRAPYGKFLKKGWGAEIQATPAWVLMELPAFIIPLIFFSLFRKNQPTDISGVSRNLAAALLNKSSERFS